MASAILSAELSATCNALGYSTGVSYHTDPYVKETITDLIRFLRRDDEDHTIRRHLGSAKILQTDLLPILIHRSEKEELFDVVLRLLVNLTNPALLIYQEELPGDRITRHYYMQIISHLQNYKEAFAQQEVWEVLAKKLEILLNLDYHDRDEDQSRTIERILILARNVLQIPADADAERRPDSDASVHDQVLWSLHQGGMVDLFLYIATTDREQQYYMHILEVVSLMLREQNPATLASAALQRSVEEKEMDEKELLKIRQMEILEKQAKVKKYTGSRHSRFGGTFIIKDVKSISDKDLIYHKPLDKAVTLSLDFDKQRTKVPKNRLALSDQTSERRSAFSVRLFLKEFCVEFLNGAYNSLMHKVRENLVRAVGQPNDETFYFWAMKFFMEFNRLYKFEVKLISETMSQQIFHFVQTQMENWLEMMITDKKHIPLWSRRVHHALKAYQELMMTLQEMSKSKEGDVRRSAEVIKSNVFYQSEYRELILFLFNVFTEVKFSRVYLKDLVETTHILMRMLELFCKQHRNLLVQGKPKRKKKKTRKSKPSKQEQVNLELIWDQVGPELSSVLQGEVQVPSDVVPFDATSSLSMDEQKIEAMKKIQVELKNGNFEQAVGLLRASREVWPENDSFGRADMPPDEEFLAMREIFFADIGQPAETQAPQDEEEDDNEADDEEEEGSAQDIVIPESVFDFKSFVGRFACPKVLAAVCLLLDTFEKNSAFTNKCIVKLLHRVAVDCKMPQMLFQATVFRTFQRALDSTNPDHKEIARLGRFIVREFVKMAATNKKLYMEMLFWKTSKEAYALEHGYEDPDTKSHSAKNVWAEEHEDELRRLAQEYEENTPDPPVDAVDWIMKNMINQSRSRKAVMKKLKELYLIVPKPKKTKEMSEEEISELKSLYEEYKDSPDPMNCILGRLSVPRSRNVLVNKLLEVGLISDRKELRKKRTAKSGKSGKERKKSNKELEWGDRSDDESIYDSWSDDEPGSSTSTAQKKKTVKLRRIGQPSVPQMCCNLRKVMDAGEELKEALEWLQTSLQEVLDDLPDAEEDEPTALLPLTPSCIQAMDNPTFIQLLDIFSIEKPTDQEMYWRIPGSWKADDLTTRINLITDALNGKLPDFNPDDIEELVKLPGIPRDEPKEDKEKKENKRMKKSEQFVRKDKAGEISSQFPSSSSSDEDEARPTQTTISENCSSDDNTSGSTSISIRTKGKEIIKKKPDFLRLTSFISDSNNENSKTESTEMLLVSDKNKNANFNSRDNCTVVKKRKSIESDSEEPGVRKKHKDELIAKRKRLAIRSDSEDTSDEDSGHKRKGYIVSSPSQNVDEKNYTLNSTIPSSSLLSQEKDTIPLTQKENVATDSDSCVLPLFASVGEKTYRNLSSPSSTHKKSRIKRKRLSILSDSDDDESLSQNKSAAFISGESDSIDEVISEQKRPSVESDLDEDKDCISSKLASSLSQDDSKDSLTVSSPSQKVDEQNYTLNSTMPSTSLLIQKKDTVPLTQKENLASDSDSSVHPLFASVGENSDTTLSSSASTHKESRIKRKRLSILPDSDDDESLSQNKSAVFISGKSNSIDEDIGEQKRPRVESDLDEDKDSISSKLASALSQDDSKDSLTVSLPSQKVDEQNYTLNSTMHSTT